MFLKRLLCLLSCNIFFPDCSACLKCQSANDSLTSDESPHSSSKSDYKWIVIGITVSSVIFVIVLVCFCAVCRAKRIRNLRRDNKHYKDVPMGKQQLDASVSGGRPTADPYREAVLVRRPTV